MAQRRPEDHPEPSPSLAAADTSAVAASHVAVLDRGGVCVFVAAGAGQAAPAPPCNFSACQGRRWAEVCPVVAELPPRRRESLLRAVDQVLGGGSAGFQATFRSSTFGRSRWMSIRVTPVVSPDGGALIIVDDITDRKHIEQRDRLLREVDRRILENRPLDEILHAMCRGLVMVFGLPLAFVSLKDRDGRVSIQAAAGPAARWLEGVSPRWDDTPEGRGPSGKAIRTCRLAASDVEADPDFDPWRERAQAGGLRSYVAFPLMSGGAALGALVLYGRGSPAVPPSVVSSLMAFADRVAVAIRESRHRQQIQLQSATLEAATHAMLITDQSGVIEWANPALSRLTGYALEEVLGRRPSMFQSGRQDPAFYEQMWQTISSGQSWRGELVNRRKDGSLYLEDLTITPVTAAGSAITHFIAVKEDATQRRQHADQVRYLTLHDPTTGLPNRRALLEALGPAADRARRGHPAAVVLLDVDNFSLVYDAFGHSGAERMLRQLARHLGSSLRPGDLLARVGGDEFAVLLYQVGPEEARAVAERLRADVAATRFMLDDRPVALTFSAGVAPVDGTLDADAVLSLATHGLQAAKDEGGNRCILLHPGDPRGVELAEAGRWVTRIRDALQHGGLMLHFQPVMRITSREPEHWEALVRLRADDGSLVLPSAFLPAAERFGLMPQVDRWVIDQVMPMLRNNPDLHLFVNVSAASLDDDDLLCHIEQSVATSGIQPGQLVFEVTETAAVRDVQHARTWMNRLALAGCRFALDDFGKGFSSLLYLRSLPVDYIKIDGSFVRSMDSDPASAAIVKATVAMAHALGKQVVAEWVESESVLRMLARMKVDYGQGWHCGRPGGDLPEPSAREA